MVSTSWGNTLLKQNMPEQAILHLTEGFNIEKRLGNNRGLGIVTPILCRALQQVGKQNEAIQTCNQAINIAPRNNRLLKLKSNLESPVVTKEGIIKCIITKDSGYLFGFIKPNDGSKDIYFRDKYVGKELILILKEGLSVISEIEETPRGPRAKRVWRDEE